MIIVIKNRFIQISTIMTTILEVMIVIKFNFPFISYSYKLCYEGRFGTILCYLLVQLSKSDVRHGNNYVCTKVLIKINILGV